MPRLVTVTVALLCLTPATWADAGADVAPGAVDAASPWLTDAAGDAADASAPSTTVSRGPYLQMGTPTSAIIRWRTSATTDSVVRVGPAPGALDTAVQEPTLTTEHAVTITGLTPATRYHYAIGSSTGTLAGDGSNTYFVTPPAAGSAAPTRIWVLGDGGQAGPQLAGVRDSYDAFAGGRHTDLLLLLGDNAYYSGTDAEYQAALFDFHAKLLRRTFVWPTIGNHDTAQFVNTPDDIPYLLNFSLPTRREAGGVASGTERYYSFDHANVHFVCLDSMSSSRAADGPMLTWLKADLAANTREWLVAFFHHPPYTKGSHDSDVEADLVDVRQSVVPVLELAGADLVLTGHSHGYERSYLLAGHHGPVTSFTPAMKKSAGSGRRGESGAYVKAPGAGRPGEGTVYVVAGSSSILGGGRFNHPAMFIAFKRAGSLVIDVDGPRLDARFLRDNGLVDDTFAIVKDAPSTPANQAPVLTLAADRGASSVPGSFVLTASAEDPDGSIARVELVSDGTTLATLTTAPHRFNWTGLPAGIYVVNARAFDDRGGSTLSTPLTLAVADPPPGRPPESPPELPPEAPEVPDAGRPLDAPGTDPVDALGGEPLVDSPQDLAEAATPDTADGTVRETADAAPARQDASLEEAPRDASPDVRASSTSSGCDCTVGRGGPAPGAWIALAGIGLLLRGRRRGRRDG
jgi:MYXO-CTERM domain-containing protein